MNIIEKLRHTDSLVLCVTVDNVQLETLSKAEVFDEFGKVRVDGLRLCRLGNIDLRPRIMCRLLHYALTSYITKRKDVQESKGDHIQRNPKQTRSR